MTTFSDLFAQTYIMFYNCCYSRAQPNKVSHLEPYVKILLKRRHYILELRKHQRLSFMRLFTCEKLSFSFDKK